MAEPPNASFEQIRLSVLEAIQLGQCPSLEVLIAEHSDYSEQLRILFEDLKNQPMIRNRGLDEATSLGDVQGDNPLLGSHSNSQSEDRTDESSRLFESTKSNQPFDPFATTKVIEEKEKCDPYATVIMEDLEINDTEPIEERINSNSQTRIPQRVWQWCKANPGLTGFVITIVLSLVCVAVIGRLLTNN